MVLSLFGSEKICVFLYLGDRECEIFKDNKRERMNFFLFSV